MLKKFIASLKNADLKEYRSIPFWSWNDKLEPDELKRQIAWMKENGIGGFFMHARSGLKTEYLSDEWFECIKTCADYAEELGMDGWAYDENGWPSGFAGGRLLENEEDRDCYILHTKGALDKNATVSYLIDGDRLVRTDVDGQGEYLNIFIETAVATTDILNPDLVKRFLDITHGEYKKRFGDNFSQKIKGFFTDEPQYQRWKTSYSRMLPQYFSEHYGIDIMDQLGLLIVEKQGYRQFRYRYWRAMQELMLNNFAKQLYDWCDKNGVELTGHYAQEDSLGLQMTSNAGVMPFYQYEHIPGIDWLGKETNYELTAKQVSSAAEQLGKKKVLTETFGCCGWDSSPAELGRILGYQYVNGINMYCQHLIPYAEYGNRKRDFPAHFSPINPWVREGFREFNLAFTRLGYLLGESVKKTNVAVLHPIRSTYFGYYRELEREFFGVEEIEKGFYNTCKMLSSRNISYHYLDETLLAQYGFVDNNKIGCGKAIYDYLIIPPIYTMDTKTEKFIRSYIENGGKVLLMGNKPEFLEAEPFDYSYLKSNCTIEDIVRSQPYSVKNTDTELVSVMAEYEGVPFIFVQNASSSDSYKQTFCLPEKYRSFKKLDLVTLETENLPLDIKLEKNEFALLIPSEDIIEEKDGLKDMNFRFSNANVSFDKNILTVDNVCFSKDGINYSKSYNVMALYNKLIKEKFNGKLYLKYCFEIKEVPSEIFITAEEFSINNACLNGKELKFTEETKWAKHFYKADISDCVKAGKNEYVITFDWIQDEYAYLALFGENVTEGLKNCLLNQNEIEAIYVCGKFGVYADNFKNSNHNDFIMGDGFYIGKVPTVISETVTQGLPFFNGTFTLSQKVRFDNTDIRLILDGNYQMAKLRINGKFVKSILFDRTVDISRYLCKGENTIEADFTVSPINTLGPHHYNGEKYGPLSPYKFELTNYWNDGESPEYHPEYDFLKLYS